VQIDQRSHSNVVVLDLHGKIAAGDVLIHQRIQTLVAHGVHDIVLNFADVSYMDSVGLSTMVRSHLTVRQHDGRLALLHLPARIADLLRLTGLTAVFDTFDDESVAIHSFERPGVAPIRVVN
jgi:anti-anti-sigma factor